MAKHITFVVTTFRHKLKVNFASLSQEPLAIKGYSTGLLTMKTRSGNPGVAI